MGFNTLLLEKSDGVGLITLDRPEVLNALNLELFRELDAAVTELEADESVRAIVFTGSGERAFSAGADIHEMARMAEEPNPQPASLDEERHGYTWHIAACAKPTIGAMNGLAYGGGAMMASSFDIRVGCERTSFKFLAASYGRVNSTWSLPMQVGWPAAKELLFTARVVGAEEAYRIGLLNDLVPSERLMHRSMEIAGQIAANDPRMVQGIKELMIRHIGAGWLEMFESEAEARGGALKPTPTLDGFKDFLARKGRA